MREIVFTFSNTHGAIIGEKTLLEAGMAIRVMPLPSAIGAGCGLCLRIDEDNLKAAIEILLDAGIQPEAAYSKFIKNGQVQYIKLENH